MHAHDPPDPGHFFTKSDPGSGLGGEQPSGRFAWPSGLEQPPVPAAYVEAVTRARPLANDRRAQAQHDHTSHLALGRSRGGP